MCAFDTPSAAFASRLVKEMYANQVLIQSAGRQRDRVRLRPLLDTTTQHVDELIRVLSLCLESILKDPLLGKEF